MISGIFIPIFKKGGERELKVKCIKRYNDIRLHKTIEIGTVLDVDEARANHLIHEGMVEIVKETEKESGKEKG